MTIPRELRRIGARHPIPKAPFPGQGIGADAVNTPALRCSNSPAVDPRLSPVGRGGAALLGGE